MSAAFIHILIVEDDTSTCQMIRRVLERSGFTASSAGDIAQALKAIRQHAFDLILLDVSLPDGNGFEVCQFLQKEAGWSRIPVLFISSHEDVETKIRGFEVGGVDYITKPVAGAELIARVSTHLRLKRAYEELAELQAERISRLAHAQEGLMPQPAQLPQARFGIRIRQVLQAGGDFYDVIAINDHLVDYVVADASGHDLASSFWTAALKTLIAQNAHPAHSPRDIVHQINNALRRILPEGVFFTLIYARLNRRTGTLTLVNAAHPPAVLVPAAGGSPRILAQQGDLVGMFADAVYDSLELRVVAGDRLLLYSDGLIEMGTSHVLGLERLLAELPQLQQASSLDQYVAQLLERLSAGQTVTDDIVLLGVDV